MTRTPLPGSHANDAPSTWTWSVAQPNVLWNQDSRVRLHRVTMSGADLPVGRSYSIMQISYDGLRHFMVFVVTGESNWNNAAFTSCSSRVRFVNEVARMWKCSLFTFMLYCSLWISVNVKVIIKPSLPKFVRNWIINDDRELSIRQSLGSCEIPNIVAWIEGWRLASSFMFTFIAEMQQLRPIAA